MSPIDLDRLLQSFRPDRRAFLRGLALGTAYVAPIVASFSMDGLVRAASAGVASNLCSNVTGNLVDVTVTKTADKNVVVEGDNLTYTVRVANCNLGTLAQNVAFQDFLPPNAAFVSATQVSGVPFTLVLPAVGELGGIVSGTADAPMPAGEAVFEIVVQVVP